MRSGLPQTSCARSLKPARLRRGKPGNLIQRQGGVELEEATDIGVLAVAPVLPELVGAEHVGVEPDRAIGGFAHLGAR